MSMDRDSGLFEVSDGICAVQPSGNTVRHYVAEPYGYHLYLATDRATYRELAAHFRVKIGDQEDQEGEQSCDTHGAILIGVYDGALRTLVHETCHATMRIFGRVKMKVCPETEEAFCYLQEAMYAAFEKEI